MYITDSHFLNLSEFTADILPSGDMFGILTSWALEVLEVCIYLYSINASTVYNLIRLCINAKLYY